MNAPSTCRSASNKAWSRLGTLALALSILGCSTTGGQDWQESSAVSDSQGDGKFGEAALRGVGGAALGALRGTLESLRCGLAAPLCAPFMAIAGGLIYGVIGIASTPGLGNASGGGMPDAVPSPPSDSDPPTTPSDAAPEQTSGSDSLTTASLSNARPEAPAIADRPRGIDLGGLWSYTYVDSRSRQSATRRFEIAQLSESRLTEQIVLEDGTRLTAEHHGGAYLSMVAGLEFSPYYFAFERAATSGTIDNLRVEHGDACANTTRYGNNTYVCEVSAVFLRTESVTVPAGTFEAHVVRVNITQQAFGPWPRRDLVAEATYWIAPSAGRIVKAVVRYELERPWSETMELTSFRTALRQDATPH